MKFIDMSDYNLAAKVYWYVMVAIGALICGWGIGQTFAFNPGQWMQFLALASLVVISSSHPIRIPNTKASVTAGDTFIFLGAIFLGTPAALLLGAADSFVSSLRTSKRATSWISAPAMMATTVFIASNVFYLALDAYSNVSTNPLGTERVQFSQLIAPLVLMALLQYFLNGWTVAALHALKGRRSIWDNWRNGYLWTSWTFFGAAIAAMLLHEAIINFGVLQVALSIPVVGATYATYKVYFERMNQKTREAAEVNRLHLATVEALATAIDAKDQTTHCHVRRVQIYAAGMGKLLRLSEGEIEALEAGALLHDIGKLAVPDHILNKPGKLTAPEFEKMKIHTTVGAQILERVKFPYPVAPIVRHHHERWDGKGYPEGLRGEAIPVTARILTVVDSFDSVREDRPYRRGMTREEASQLLRNHAGTHFDPKIVALFLCNLESFETKIELADLAHHGFTTEECDPRGLIEGEPPFDETQAALALPLAPKALLRPLQPAYLQQIKDAHREVYALYETARTFSSSLDVEDIASVLVNKVGQIIPFDTCAIYLYDERKGYARVVRAAGRNADVLQDHCLALGEGVTGFVLANRIQAEWLDPMLDFAGLLLAPDTTYRSMIALPLIKGDHLLGAVAVYSLQPNRYTEDHLRLLDTMTRLASDAFGNAINHAQAETNALTDPLTGLPNGRALHVRFEEESARARRTNHTFQVVMLDLDDFKAVNDTFGHKIGDQMLREAARILGEQLREYDFLARYAGDEFVAIVHDLVGDQVEDLRERIERAITKFSLHVEGDKHARVGISVGTANYALHGETLDQLLIHADQAMYRAKSDRKQQMRAEIERAKIDTNKLASPSIN
ncbi:MAG: diguanylate cyclase [Pyrinomonadaceae bacterium]|nr:diguanylate cyclase [Pyrinomonadaceae bacterium]